MIAVATKVAESQSLQHCFHFFHLKHWGEKPVCSVFEMFFLMHTTSNILQEFNTVTQIPLATLMQETNFRR